MKLNIDFDLSDLLIVDFIKDFDGYQIELDYCWDDLTLYDIKVLNIDVIKKTLYIKYIAVSSNF